ncbi:hypothetical protein CesoFtcFv8_009128 [Champsocephalus esox]|uniref:Uncharacterized protein n=1 Tax=Champsocephalus esox TaxID=159716 RepID=A0AAN8H1C9_9TELE|nr:hypothetical protein CesoFtcFv8_009128 [Champsocephalus esox]
MISSPLGTPLSPDHCVGRERRRGGKKTSRFIRHMDPLCFLLICLKKLPADSFFNVRASLALDSLCHRFLPQMN